MKAAKPKRAAMRQPNGQSESSTLRENAPEYGTAPPRFIDLFCGIGGFRIAFERAGSRCVFSSDYDKFSQQTYEANFGERPHGDIHSVAVADIPAHDILCGGFPCQPFSIAGVSKKLSLGRKHGFLPRVAVYRVPAVSRRRPKAWQHPRTETDPKYTLSDHLWNYLQNYAAKHRAAGNGFGFGPS